MELSPRWSDCLQMSIDKQKLKPTRQPPSCRGETPRVTNATNHRVSWAKSVKFTRKTTLQRAKKQIYQMKKSTPTKTAAICTSPSVVTVPSLRASRWRKDTNKMQTINPGKEGRTKTLSALMPPHRSPQRAALFLHAQLNLMISWKVLSQIWTFIRRAISKSRTLC